MTGYGEATGYCPNGHPVRQDMVFCAQCGAYRDAPSPRWDTRAPGAYPPPPSYPPPPAFYPPAGHPAQGSYPPHSVNGLAVASLVLGVLWIYGLGSLLAVIFGSVAISQIRHDGHRGRGMAIAGLSLGVAGIIAVVVLIAVAAASTTYS